MKTITFVAMEPTSSVAYFLYIDQVLRLVKKHGLDIAGDCNVKLILFSERLFRKNSLNFSFNVSNIKFTFERVHQSPFKFKLICLTSFNFSLYLFFKIVFTNKDFKSLFYDGIFVGDSLLSIALRRSSNPKLKLGLRFFLYLLRIIYIIKVTKSSNIKHNANYLLLFDWHYYERILYRCMSEGKVKLVDSISYQKNESIIDIDRTLDYSPFIVKKRNNFFSNSMKEKVDNFLKQRICNPGDFQWYLKGNGNLTTNSVLDEYGKDIVLPENNRYIACIFLHSFVDGFVDTICDGFVDQIEYLEFLIHKILCCGFYDQIYIKPHPQTFSTIYPTDEKGINYLKKKFRNKVKFLHKRASLLALSKANIVCFSHHGSVVEECHYLKMPCVGFMHGPWREFSQFLYTWESKFDLEHLIYLGPKNLPYIDNDAFYKYVYEYRLKHPNNIKDPFLLCAANVFSINHDKSFNFGHSIAEKVKIYGLAESLNKTAKAYQK
jgi:hypothetical protein